MVGRLNWIGLGWKIELDWKIGRLEDWKINGRIWLGIGLESREDFGSWKGLGSLESWESLGGLEGWES